MPDKYNIMSDDELDELERKERDEFEAKLKARRDKVAQDRFARDEEERKHQELLAKAEEVKQAIGGDYQFEHLFDVLVPDSGKCESLAGELIRACNKIEYRWFNDGDRWFEDYGIETAGPAAKFIMDFEIENETPFWDFMMDWAEDGCQLDGENDESYDNKVEELKNSLSTYIESHPELLAMETKDMYDIDYRDVEEFLDEHGLIPTYDYDASIPDELQAHLEKNISERDLQWEIESWCENMGCYDAQVDVDEYSVYLSNLTKAAYDEFHDNLYKWLEQYAEELTQQYGDPFEEEEEETEEEEVEEDE